MGPNCGEFGHMGHPATNVSSSELLYNGGSNSGYA